MEQEAMKKSEALRWAIERAMDAEPSPQRFEAVELLMKEYRCERYWETRRDD